MHVNIFQHVPFEGPGSIASWLERRKARVTWTRFLAGDLLTSLDSVDLLIVLGGPMSANDEARLPWLRAEKGFVREAIDRDIPVLGVCLGAQVIASALGARVYPNAAKEIGWFPIKAAPAQQPSFGFPPECLVFHWHGDTFDLPDRAVRLATSRACENQAFQMKRNVIGLQFHLETTPDSMRALVENCRDELVPAEFIQSEQKLFAAPNAQYEAINELMNDVLSYLAEAR